MDISLEKSSPYPEKGDVFEYYNKDKYLIVTNTSKDKYKIVNLSTSEILDEEYDDMDDLLYNFQIQPDSIVKEKDLILKRKGE